MVVRFFKKEDVCVIEGINIPIPSVGHIVTIGNLDGKVKRVEWAYLVSSSGKGIKDVSVDIIMEFL